jgi:hypothetical protein
MGEEGVRHIRCRYIFSVQRFRQDAHFSSGLGECCGVSRRVNGVLCRQEHGSSGEHDRGVVHDPVVVPSWQSMDGMVHERRALGGKYEVVGNTDLELAQEDPSGRLTYRLSDRQNDIPVALQEVVHAAPTSDIQVHVYTSKVVQNIVSDRIGALDGVGVRIEHVQMVRVMRFDEFARGLVGPEHILAVYQYHSTFHTKGYSLVFHPFSTFFPRFAPFKRQNIVFPRLVDQSRNSLARSDS